MAITHVGEYKFPETDNANDTGSTLTLVTSGLGAQANDVVVMFASFRALTATSSITTTGGQTWTEHIDTVNDFQYAVYSCVFNGTWDADPVITCPEGAAPRILWAIVRRGVDTTTPWDVAPTIEAASGGDQTFAFDTNTDGAEALLGGGQGDNNTGTVDNGFTAPSGSGNMYWRSAGGADFNMGFATKVIASAGPIGTTTFDWAFNESTGIQWYGALKPAGAGTNLVIADATHGHTADNIALTQHNVLAIQDANHGHTVDSPSLTQHNVLAIQDATHGHTVDSPSLTQHNVLAIQDASHGHVADTLALTQHNVLAIQDALHAHAADNVVLSSDSTLLVIQDALHAHTADNVSLIQHFILVIADALHGHAADNIALTQHNVLAIDDALHAHLADHIHDIGGDFGDTAEQNVVRLRRRKQPIGT